MVGSPFTAFTFCDLSDVYIQFRNCLKKDRAALLLQVITCWAVSYLQGNVRGEFNCNSEIYDRYSDVYETYLHSTVNAKIKPFSSFHFMARRGRTFFVVEL